MKILRVINNLIKLNNVKEGNKIKKNSNAIN